MVLLLVYERLEARLCGTITPVMANVAQWLERLLVEQKVVGSNPIVRPKLLAQNIHQNDSGYRHCQVIKTTSRQSFNYRQAGWQQPQRSQILGVVKIIVN